MANSSLTAEPCSHNDADVVSFLPGLIESSYRYYAGQGPQSLIEFISLLRTIVGHGFTACLVAGYDSADYQMYLLRFTQYRYADPQAFMTRPKLSDSVSKMVELALGSFCTLGYPDYYKSFIQAIAKMIDNPEVKTSNQSEQAKQLLELLINRGNNGG